MALDYHRTCVGLYFAMISYKVNSLFPEQAAKGPEKIARLDRRQAPRSLAPGTELFSVFNPSLLAAFALEQPDGSAADRIQHRSN